MSARTSRRDAGLQLISRVNRWVVVASIGLAGMISVVAKGSFHGHTASAATSSSSRSAASSSGSASSSSSGDGSLQQPAQAPAASPGPVAPVATSGGS